MIEAHESNIPRRRILKGAALLGFAAAACPRRGWASEENRLNFYNWDTYTGETTLSTFTERTGIGVSLDLYASNEELFAKLSQGNPGYDVIVPGNEMVETMRAVGLLQPLDHGRIPHIANIDAHFREPQYDPDMAHSVPYMRGHHRHRLSQVEGRGAADELARDVRQRRILRTHRADGRHAAGPRHRAQVSRLLHELEQRR